MRRVQEAEIVLGNLLHAVEMLERCTEFAGLIPEVRVNIVYALAGAKTPHDVAAVDGRITRVRGRPHASGMPAWGASDHMARLVLELRKFDSTINAGINFRYDDGIQELVEQYCREKDYRFGLIDRRQEPAEAALVDGASIPWKAKHLVSSCGGVPRLFYESENPGKEPLYFAVGKDAVEVAGVAIDIAKRYKKRLSKSAAANRR